ncbi:hypothetical protein GGTG_00180 [Gaeumannomyces tritici R3-111a-1]|uniref:Uncharacterized protein n=1 Tax=Gaeumannomyces tritici (strain R3-111a-1) TaxID=644352 RepID=J3NFY7_GAET3|nr:hypothetical protein GGTG_00180 [Gaeumannomyces tritici R3-111a-1]EJT80177.1 hypothetical protein GGTG_00180 [Gaeumannomyces tritici R3-111a-1]
MRYNATISNRVCAPWTSVRDHDGTLTWESTVQHQAGQCPSRRNLGLAGARGKRGRPEAGQ